MKKILLLVFCLIFNLCFCLAVTIKSDFKIYIHSNSNDTNKIMDISTIYSFKHFNDSVLTITYNSIIQELGLSIQELRLKDAFNRSILKEYYDIIYSVGYIKIKFKKKLTNFNLYLNYTYIGSTRIVLDDLNKPCMSIFGGFETFEFFNDFIPKVNDLISIDKIEISTSNNLFFISSIIPYHVKKGIYYYRNIDKEKISKELFVVLEKENYNFKKNKIGNNNKEYNLYYRFADSISTSFDTILNNVNNFEMKIIRNRKDINIIQFYWKYKNFSCGMAFDNVVMMDMNFFNKKISSLIHELLHPILKINYKTSNKAFYLISESLTEYLSQTIYFNRNKNRLEEYFEKERDILSKNDSVFSDSISIYDISVNEQKSWTKIYTVGPLIFYDLAKTIGYDRFEYLAVEFYKRNKAKRDVTYENFIKHLLKNKVNPYFVKEFDKQVHAVKLRL